MEKRICIVNATDVATKDVLKIRLPYATDGSELTFAQGDLLKIGALEAGSRDLYESSIPTSANDETAIIINQDVFKDQFGKKTGDNKQIGYIRYFSGEVVTVIRPSKDVEFLLSTVSLTNPTDAAVGKFVVASADETKATVVDSISTEKVAYEITTVGVFNSPDLLPRVSMVTRLQ